MSISFGVFYVVFIKDVSQIWFDSPFGNVPNRESYFAVLMNILVLGGFMKQKGLDFKHKEVINISDGKRLGYVQDVTANLETGTITSIIVPGGNKFFNLISSDNEIVIPWEKVKCIGEDLILVEI